MSAPRLPAELLAVMAALSDPADLTKLLDDLLTPSEIGSLSERWSIVLGLAAGQSHRAVKQRLGCSVTTVSRGSRQLKYGGGGFAMAFDTLVTLGHDDPRAAAKGKKS